MIARDRDRVALDVGGANLKLAHSSGTTRSRPFALWREPGRLGHVLSEELRAAPPFEVALLTMTAELCDCFATKREGVLAVLEAVLEAVDGRPLLVWGIDAAFHTPEAIREDPALAAASNWLALATVAASLVPRGAGLLIDVGSTTTDLVPLLDGRVAAIGRTDAERLGSGELVYAGVRRTPVFALATSLPFRGRATGLCAELFATTHDVYLLLGDQPEAEADRETADGRPATLARARDRLARMVGEDSDGVSLADARALAVAADEALVARIVVAAERASRTIGGRPDVVVVAGSGEFLARRVAARVVGTGGTVVGLATLWGAGASTAACAQALLMLERAEPGATGS